MSDGNYSYASDSSERVADELNILNTWMAQIVETGLPQISAQLAEIWGEQAKRRESDSEFVQTVGKLALVGGDNVNGLGCGVHRRFDVSQPGLGVVGGVQEAHVSPDLPSRFLKRVDVGHFSFFLSGLACGPLNDIHKKEKTMVSQNRNLSQKLVVEERHTREYFTGNVTAEGLINAEIDTDYGARPLTPSQARFAAKALEDLADCADEKNEE